MSTNQKSPGVLVPAVLAAVSIVRALNEERGGGRSLPELVKAVGVTKSHCHNILRTLVAQGWAEYDPVTRRYQLASGLAADSSSSLMHRTHLNTVRPIAEALANAIGIPVIVAEPLADGSYLILHLTQGPDPHVLNASVGYRFPLGTSAQMKAKLAWAPLDELEYALAQWEPVQHSPRSIMDRSEMKRQILAARQRGYARSAGEYMDGFLTVALPVFNREGRPFLIVSIGSANAVMEPREQEIVNALISAVADIHREIDGRPPVDFPRPAATVPAT